jgi:hypothetical protein
MPLVRHLCECGCHMARSPDLLLPFTFCPLTGLCATAAVKVPSAAGSTDAPAAAQQPRRRGGDTREARSRVRTCARAASPPAALADSENAARKSTERSWPGTGEISSARTERWQAQRSQQSRPPRGDSWTCILQDLSNTPVLRQVRVNK